MKILEIYKSYNIPQNIQDHQLKVASVASLIMDSQKSNFDNDLIITTCLLHDMGNIIKSDFDIFPEFLEPEGRSYWENVKKDFIEKYGQNEDKATQQIVKELKVDNRISKMLENFKFKDEPKNILEKHVNLCIYSDLRVGPHGIITSKDRIDDAEKRYIDRGIEGVDKDYFKRMHKIWPKREKEILENSNINPEDINEKAIRDIITRLSGYSLVAE